MDEDGSAQTLQPAIPRFRPIHYLGSKLRALEPILDSMDRLDPARGPLCDLFAGSGTVAYAASHRRKVIAVDIQRYSATICSALLSPRAGLRGEELAETIRHSAELAELHEAALPLIQLEQDALASAMLGDLGAIADILEDGALVRLAYGHHARLPALRRAQSKVDNSFRKLGVPSVVLRHFGGVFFSYAQALSFDAALAVIRRLEPDGDVLVAALLSAMSQIVNTVGKQFAQPLRLRSKSGQLKQHLKSKILADRAADPLTALAQAVDGYRTLPPSRTGHEVLCEDYRSAMAKLGGRVSLIYADPPYTRDHYSRYYHVLETVAIGDDPEIALSNLGGGKLLSRGLYRADRYQSDFCIRSKAPDAFRALFAGVRGLGVPLLLSYSAFDADEDAHPRVVGLAEVTALAKEFFPRVEVEELSLFSYSKLNNGALHKGAEGTKEVLIACG